jgi:hypothetical protein
MLQGPMKDNQIKYKSDTSEVSVKEIIIRIQLLYSYILSKWMLILLFAILGGAVGLAYACYKKPLFTAKTTFVLEDSEKGGGMGQYAGLASMVGIEVAGGSGGIFQGDNILELYKSRTMIEKTLLTNVDIEGKKQTLLQRYIDYNKLKEGWKETPELNKIDFAKLAVTTQNINNKTIRLRDSVLGSIVKEINLKNLNVIKPDKKLSIIEATVRANDEIFAKLFDEQIVKNVNDFYIQTKTKNSLENIYIMQKKTDSVRAVMNGAIFAAAAVADATPNLNITRQAQRSAPLQRSQFSAETNRNILAQLVQNLELSKISLLKETPLIQVIDKPVYPLDRTRLGKFKGLLIGGLLGGLIATIFLALRRIFQALIS